MRSGDFAIGDDLVTMTDAPTKNGTLVCHRLTAERIRDSQKRQEPIDSRSAHDPGDEDETR